MEQLDPATIAEAILNASGFARVGITMRDADLRQRAALDMATHIAERLVRPAPIYDHRQIALPL